MTGQHQDRALHALLAHQPAELATVCVGQSDIEDHQIEQPRRDLRHGLLTIAGLEHVEILGHHELLAQRFAQVVLVIHQQDLFHLCHRLVSMPVQPTCV